MQTVIVPIRKNKNGDAAGNYTPVSRGGARRVPGVPLPPKNFAWPPQWPPKTVQVSF